MLDIYPTHVGLVLCRRKIKGIKLQPQQRKTINVAQEGQKLNNCIEIARNIHVLRLSNLVSELRIGERRFLLVES